MTMALEGIKIIDLTRLGPGPYCTMLLADMGADVIKVEAGGGRASQVIETMEAEVEERRRAFNAEGRNKRSIVLNLKMGGAREVFYKLVRDSDVVVEEFRPGVLKRLGADYDTISKINPGIILCSITGYGQDGPYAQVPGHDINYMSTAGAQSMIGPRGGPPVMMFNLIGDYSGGSMQAALGITLALIARERTGRGQHVDISMTDGIISLMHGEAAGYFDTGRVPTRGDLLSIGGAPFYGVYETKDGKYVSIAALEPWFYANLCELLGREDLLPYEWDTAKWDDLSAEFRKIFRTKTRDEWVELLRQKDVCVAPVKSVNEVFEDPQVVQREMAVEIEHPTLGRVKQVGIGIKLSDTPGEVRSVAPKPGQHTDEIMLGLGYTRENIAELLGSGAIA
ncbi:MAG TPA: CaiB/BaiF CoA-transferase family protein [Dehalococcoidia bacterium]|nr:CaiB/BaiF CoA-transferase family protein [Dehalococcoidia bacterium]